jgi:uncharacterized protein YndB with AHSA1/START domain
MIRVKADRATVFDAWTTGEGLSGFTGVPAEVELEIGGKMELLFLDGAPEGSKGSEGCQVLAWIPDELFAFSWNAPPSHPRARAQRTWVVLRFSDLDRGGTRVHLTHTGFGAEAHWTETYQYFQKAWPQLAGAFAAKYGPVKEGA